MPAVVRAQGEPIRLATLTPLTGAGGPYGPVMAKAAAAVVEEVNKAGGVLGRRVQLVSEDDQTNPEAGVRAARKLIDVDKVSAIMGTWASSVTTAVAPLCWESKTMLCTVSGADSITLLPHQGYLIRTQPNSTLQVRRLGEYILSLGAKRVFQMIPQTPFTQSSITLLEAALKKGGGDQGSLIYDDKKPTYRSEVDQALRYKPDLIFAAGYTPDTVVLLKDLFRAGFKGKIIGFAYSINQKLIDQIGQADVVEGIYTFAPSPAADATAYERVKKVVGTDSPDPYTCQVYDHVNLVLMAIAAAKDASGTAIRDNVRKVSQGGGKTVDNAVDGIKAIAAGEKVDYVGASGPCDFDERGDIIDCKFRYEQVKANKLTLVKIA
ncbi:ABC transporter substrate-binding protein [Vineibacter terrae]|uniref:ABC transporter substrate-binding protein n=1 Tax=Vineibacter terrae TaxID=2586908 RepID=UPI002E32BD77|nr:ABC transporter substrate-binding protein [Vineibacter terrae]HEX2886595.1 ABC transporter substrate-binding protein [Vineibacter terrae]